MRVGLLFIAIFTFQIQAQTGANTGKTSIKARDSAAAFGSKSMGHLLTSNNNMLEEGHVGVGTLYAAYGITPNWMLGTSPFAFWGFDMYNFQSRWAWNVSGKEKFGMQFEYYKTYKDEPQDYQEFGPGQYNFQMEAWDLKVTYSRVIAPYYKLNWTTSYFYYIDDTRPFSLRMDPVNGDRYSLNSTTLHEIKFSRNVFFNFEAGFFGMNYTYPYLHGGASLGLQNEEFLFSLGVTSTFSPSFPAEKARWFAGYDSRASFHPEIQVQAFF
jgi:hypothetical protein